MVYLAKSFPNLTWLFEIARTYFSKRTVSCLTEISLALYPSSFNQKPCRKTSILSINIKINEEIYDTKSTIPLSSLVWQKSYWLLSLYFLGGHKKHFTHWQWQKWWPQFWKYLAVHFWNCCNITYWSTLPWFGKLNKPSSDMAKRIKKCLCCHLECDLKWLKIGSKLQNVGDPIFAKGDVYSSCIGNWSCNLVVHLRHRTLCNHKKCYLLACPI